MGRATGVDEGRRGFLRAAAGVLGGFAVVPGLAALRGLGEWTADWFLARHLARPRAWAPGDLGVRKAIAAFYGDEDPRTVVDRFDPFQNLTVHYLLTGARVLG